METPSIHSRAPPRDAVAWRAPVVGLHGDLLSGLSRHTDHAFFRCFTPILNIRISPLPFPHHFLSVLVENGGEATKECVVGVTVAAISNICFFCCFNFVERCVILKTSIRYILL